MSRSRRRADRIRSEVPIASVLNDLGYVVRTDAADREQQFSCDLHGDGLDNKPSARAYPDSNSWYCFACNKSRDAIQTLREKRGLGFSEACKILEKSYGLPDLPWLEDEKWVNPQSEINALISPPQTFEQSQQRVFSLLDTQVRDQILSLENLLGLWEAHDLIVWHVEENLWDSKKGIENMSRLLDRALEKIKTGVRDGRSDTANSHHP